MRNYCVERDRVQGFVKIAFNLDTVSDFFHALIEFSGRGPSRVISKRRVISKHYVSGTEALKRETAILRRLISKIGGTVNFHGKRTVNFSSIFAFLDKSLSVANYRCVHIDNRQTAAKILRIIIFFRNPLWVWIGFCSRPVEERFSLFRTRLTSSNNRSDPLVGSLS
jgi:hypothetical protein